MKITRKEKQVVMLHRSSNAVEAEVAKLLTWAEEQHIIDSDGREVLVEELSRRIEKANAS